MRLFPASKPPGDPMANTPKPYNPAIDNPPLTPQPLPGTPDEPSDPDDPPLDPDTQPLEPEDA